MFVYFFFCYFWCVFCILVDWGKFLIVVVGRRGRLSDLFCSVNCFLKFVGWEKFFFVSWFSFFFWVEFVFVVKVFSVFSVVLDFLICVLMVVLLDRRFFFKILSFVNFFLVYDRLFSRFFLRCLLGCFVIGMCRRLFEGWIYNFFMLVWLRILRVVLRCFLVLIF